MRLGDDLAARRHLYSMPLITAPAVMLIEIPARFSASGLLLDRFYPVIVETLDELAEIEAFLAAERPVLQAPDLLDRRPSQRIAKDIAFFEFPPASPDWPWVLLCHWPAAHSGFASDDPDLLARGNYTTEAYHSQAALHFGLAQIVSSLGSDTEVALVPPAAGVHGHA